MAEGIKSLLVASIMVAIIVISMASFGSLFQEDMGIPTFLNESDATGSGINTSITSLTSEISTASDTGQSIKGDMENETADVTGGEINPTATQKRSLRSWDIILNLITTIRTMTAPYVPGILLVTIGTILSLVMVLYVWKLIRTGQ